MTHLCPTHGIRAPRAVFPLVLVWRTVASGPKPVPEHYDGMDILKIAGMPFRSRLWYPVSVDRCDLL